MMILQIKDLSIKCSIDVQKHDVSSLQFTHYQVTQNQSSQEQRENKDWTDEKESTSHTFKFCLLFAEFYLC